MTPTGTKKSITFMRSFTNRRVMSQDVWHLSTTDMPDNLPAKGIHHIAARVLLQPGSPTQAVGITSTSQKPAKEIIGADARLLENEQA